VSLILKILSFPSLLRIKEMF